MLRHMLYEDVSAACVGHLVMKDPHTVQESEQAQGLNQLILPNRLVISIKNKIVQV